MNADFWGEGCRRYSPIGTYAKRFALAERGIHNPFFSMVVNSKWWYVYLPECIKIYDLKTGALLHVY